MRHPEDVRSRPTYLNLFLSLLLTSLSVNAAHTQASLVLSMDTARPGGTILAGVHLRMDPHWHTYWKNSGASGQPTEIGWQLPTGVTAGAIQWPLPDKLPDADLTTYIYSDEVVLLVPLKLNPKLTNGPLNLTARVSWLECDLQCVPGKASVQATLNVGPEAKSSPDAPLLDDWQKKVPSDGQALGARAWWEKPASEDTRPLVLEWTSTKPASDVDFFPYSYKEFEVQGPTERVPAATGKISLRKLVKKFEGDWPKEISGVVIQQAGADRTACEIKAAIGVPEAATTTTPLWQLFLGAFVGGLILNVMPCVLPVIALKILGFVNQAKDAPGRVRVLGLIYSLGVLVSFLILAFLVVGLRSAGVSVGWGLQFANPYFVLVMTLLVTLIALNLFGAFEITLGGGAMTAASTLSSKHGSAGAFFNGLLTTVLATSCSAPILAGAVGVAFAQKPPIIIAVMLTVGVGLAFPYLVLSWHPAWLTLLPKPGAWMERFKVAMGFPMLAAAVWLCSLLEIHYGERAWWMATFLVFLAVAAWLYGAFVQRGTRGKGLAAALSVALLVAGYLYALDYGLQWRNPIQAGTAPSSAAEKQPSEAPKGIEWQKWSPDAVAAARSEKRPVVVDFTAKWCLTCNQIIKPALENRSVVEKLKQVNAVALLANFTLVPPDIAAELKRFDRAGVPLVLVYPRDPSQPPKVFDLVTASVVLKALDEAAR